MTVKIIRENDMGVFTSTVSAGQTTLINSQPVRHTLILGTKRDVFSQGTQVKQVNKSPGSAVWPLNVASGSDEAC